MAIQVDCPGCGKKLKIPDSSAGKRGRCPNCGGNIEVPMPSEDSQNVSLDLGTNLEDTPSMPSNNSQNFPINFGIARKTPRSVSPQMPPVKDDVFPRVDAFPAAKSQPFSPPPAS